jgi:hypothetical protein
VTANQAALEVGQLAFDMVEGYQPCLLATDNVIAIALL